MISKLPAIRRCTECKEYYQPIRYGLKVLKQCGKDCIKIAAEKIKDKEFEKETRLMRAAINDKDSSWWSDKTQLKFNQYIMLRDSGKPCISCGTVKIGIDYCAGHYVPRGRSAALRFNEFNTHRQCNHSCNLRLSGNLIEYRKALIFKYGQEKVLWLEGSHEMPRYRIEDYKRIHEEYKLKIKLLKIGAGSGD
jgi:hypothetical protein